MTKPCEHHKRCGDCFSPSFVANIERRLARLTEAAQAAAQYEVADVQRCAICNRLVPDCNDSPSDGHRLRPGRSACAGAALRRVLHEEMQGGVADDIRDRLGSK
jgi:hypothetical protein